MKTNKKFGFFYLIVLAAVLASCTKDEAFEASQVPSTLIFSVPDMNDMPYTVVNEKGVEMDPNQTRAYFTETSTGWSYRWETGDQLYFYSMRNGSLYQTGVGTIRKTSTTSTKISVSFPHAHRTGDVIYAYFNNMETEPATSPTAVPMAIPAEQSIAIGAETFKDTNGNITYGNQQIIPVRNAMPLITRPVTITSAMTNGSSSLISSLSFPMVGSLTEFRVYTSDANVALGETIKSLTIKATDGSTIAGTFSHDLTADDYLTVSGVTGSSSIVTHTEDAGFAVPQGSANYIPIQTVLAPGTYPIQIELLTDKNRYILNYNTMTYSRAIRKYFYLDLNATLVKPLVEVSDKHSVSINTENGVVDMYTADMIKDGQSFLAFLSANNGYEFKDGDIRVTMGGIDVTDAAVAGTGFVYIDKVTGDVQITATASPIVTIQQYDLYTQMSYVVFADDIHYVYDEGTPFFAQLLPYNERCTISQVFVWMGGVEITDQAYDATTQTISIPEVTGDISITAIAIKDPQLFDVTLTATHCTIDAPTSIYEDTDFEAFITPDEGYELTNVVVTMRGIDATSVCYVQQGGLGYVALPRVNGAITVTAIATPIQE